MKALRIERFGAPSDVLKLVDIPESKLGPDEVSVRIEAAAINPSDVGNVNGKFAITTLPRVVGRDFASTVIDGPDEMRGLPVWGSGGDIGFTRDGSMRNTCIFQLRQRHAGRRIYRSRKRLASGFLL